MTASDQQVLAIHINGVERDVKVRRLTVAQVRAWLRAIVERPRDADMDLIGGTLFDELTLWELAFLSDLSPLDIEEAHPGELRRVVDRVLLLNPQWAAARARILALGAAVQAAGAQTVPAGTSAR